MNITPIQKALVESGFVRERKQAAILPIQQALIDAGFITYWNEPLTARERFLVDRYRLQLTMKSLELARLRKLGNEFAERMLAFVKTLQKGNQQ